MAYQDVRDERGRLVARVDPEKREVETRIRSGGKKQLLRGTWIEEPEKETVEAGRN